MPSQDVIFALQATRTFCVSHGCWMQVSSACDCERNWSTYHYIHDRQRSTHDYIHNNQRNGLSTSQHCRLVYYFSNQ